MFSKHKHSIVTLHIFKKKVQCPPFISDVKNPYLHNTFRFLNMLQFPIENHSIEIAISDLNSNFKIFA